MRKSILTLAILAPLASLAHAVPTLATSHAPITVDATTPFTYSFSGLTLDGFQFLNLGTATGTTFAGTLTSVSVNATLDASEEYTYADDLTLYVDVLPLSTGGLLQVGGFSSLGATERHLWANGESSAPGTTVIDTVTLTTPLAFTGTSTTNPAIWLGNGYNGGTNSGTWTGSVTLNFTTAAVPEPSSWALMLAGGVGLAAWTARRRRASNDA